jgi:hypothetical protein
MLSLRRMLKTGPLRLRPTALVVRSGSDQPNLPNRFTSSYFVAAAAPPTFPERAYFSTTHQTTSPPHTSEGMLGVVQDSTTANVKKQVEEANAAHSGRIEIRPTEERGWGLIALRDFDEGEFLMRGNVLERKTEPDSHSLQTGFDEHTIIDLPARFINHRCNDANVGVQLSEETWFEFYAIRKIPKEAELLWDYETTEFELSSPFECTCGENCRGKVRGFRHHSQQVLESYGPNFVAPYLLQWHREEGTRS